MTEYRRVAPTFKAVQFTGNNVEEIEALIGKTRVTVMNKGLVNAAPQVVVHAALGSPSLATLDWVTVEQPGGRVDVVPDKAFPGAFQAVEVDHRYEPELVDESSVVANVDTTDAEVK